MVYLRTGFLIEQFKNGIYYKNHMHADGSNGFRWGQEGIALGTVLHIGRKALMK